MVSIPSEEFQGKLGEELPVNFDEALPFLRVVHPDLKGFTICTIDEARHVRPIKFIENPEEVASAITECVAAQVAQKAVGVYFSLGTFATRPAKRGREHEVEQVPCVWVDLDVPDKTRAYEIIEGFHKKTGLWPSIIVDTGGGLQIYWLLEEPVVVGPWADGDPYPINAVRVRAVNVALARMMDGDTVGDLPRLFRLPGTRNSKPHYTVPPPCEIVAMEPELRYRLEDLEKIVTEEDRAKAEGSRPKSAVTIDPDKALPATLPTGFLETLTADPKLSEYLLDNEMNESEADYRLLMYAGEAYRQWANARDLTLLLVERRRHVDTRGKGDRVDYIGRTVARVLSDLARNTETDPKKAFFEKRHFLPRVLADAIMKRETFMTSPIDCRGKGVILRFYRNGVFRRDGEDVARRIAHELLGREARPDWIEQTVATIKEVTKRPMSDINPQATQFVNVENGMLDWETGAFLPHSPTYLSTIRINATYDPSARSDILEEFLTTTVPSETMPILEEMLGYLILPTTRFHAAFILTGGGANGKSTFLVLAEAFLGEDNVVHVSLHELSDHKFKAAELHEKLVCTYADLDNGAVKSAGLFKLIAAGDKIQGERKFEHPFEFKPFARLLFSANELPIWPDRTKAFLRRLLVIPFPYVFDGSDSSRKPDPDLGEKLSSPEVRSALLNVALRGLQRLMANGGFTVPSAVAEAINNYRAKNDSSVGFITERFIRGNESDRISKEDVWTEYRAYCEGSGFDTLNRREFNERMGEILHPGEGTTTVNGHRVRAWTEIRKREP